MGASVNEQCLCLLKRKFDALKFSSVNVRTNLFIECADSPRMEGWCLEILALNSLGSPMTTLGAAIENISRVTKHRSNFASIYVLEQENSIGLGLGLKTYLSSQT